MQGWFFLPPPGVAGARKVIQHLKLVMVLLVLLALGLTACAQPAHGGPVPTVTPTWGVFYPTVVPFSTATATPGTRPTVSPTAGPTQQPGVGVGPIRPIGSEETF